MAEPPKRPELPPVDPALLERAVGRMLAKKRPPGGWSGKPPKDVRAEPEDVVSDEA